MRSAAPAATEDRAPPLRIRGLRTALGKQLVHDGLDLEVKSGEVLGLVGGSGSGKSLLLKAIIGLLPPQAGTVELFGTDIYADDEATRNAIKRRWGMLFQANALFSTLTVRENIEVPLRAWSDLEPPLLGEIADLKAALAGLPREALEQYPNELSGGMQKRTGIARAIALDPELLLLDEPTAGLDPIMAAQIDRLVRVLADTLGLTVVLVTHDLDTLYSICDRVAALGEGRIIAVAPLGELEKNDDPWLRDYLHGTRSRAGIDMTQYR